MKKVKNFIKNIANKVKLKKKKFEEQEKQCVKIDNLPEKVEFKLRLSEFVTFGFLFRTGLIILFLIYLGYVAANSLNLIYAIGTAFIISMALETSISFFEKYIPRSVSIILVYILFFFFLILGFIILIPFILGYLSQIIEIITQKITIWQNQIQTQTLEQFIKSFHLYPYLENKLLEYASNPDIANKIREFLTINISNILQTFGDYMKIISSFAFSTLSSIFNAITQIVIVFTLAVFFSFEKEKVVFTLAKLSQTPKKTAIKLKKLYYQLGEWLKGQVLLGFFIFIAVYFGLRTLAVFGINLENKGTLALMAGLMEFIPYLGPILGSLPAILVGVMNYGFSGFIAVVILFIIIQQIEGLIVPIIMNKALGVSPLLIIIMMLVGMQTMGFVGIILAIPLAVIVSLLFEDSLKDKEK